ncbi:MAG: hypothetical protein NZV14_17110 [Bryobacteraceae bacterium]|nr:hypothetical protein [Bryobacteraceae bacterium]MDW8379883.1 hypothetical protein [Bryobacterales bacterium]
MKHTWLGMIVALTGAAWMVMAAEPADLKPMDAKELSAMAKAARTPEQHLAVAKQYEVQARYFEKKAVAHEQRANELRQKQGYNAMQYKWPSMARGQELRESSLAMQARRAAKESLDRAAYHRNMASGGNAPAVGQ